MTWFMRSHPSFLTDSPWTPIHGAGSTSTGAGELTATDDRFCVYDSLSRQYGYKEAWVKKLINELKDPETYETVSCYRSGD